jgi:hypothetical protein
LTRRRSKNFESSFITAIMGSRPLKGKRGPLSLTNRAAKLARPEGERRSDWSSHC